ncbi:unnamed protein product [Protopolystoma xenopodis]|uniref:Uncharacterized protein n=1 Tax=Protopolystoma xenopodis TaxID=117903 RepID=A0A448WU31_9PLAT|nr:unnamed protein product [Protopolystoma xenopodis]
MLIKRQRGTGALRQRCTRVGPQSSFGKCFVCKSQASSAPTHPPSSDRGDYAQGSGGRVHMLHHMTVFQISPLRAKSVFAGVEDQANGVSQHTWLNRWLSAQFVSRPTQNPQQAIVQRGRITTPFGTTGKQGELKLLWCAGESDHV